jgi:uncharacterized protein YjbI with pentapeptide repeats
MMDGQGSMMQCLIGEFVDCSFTGAYLADCSLSGSFLRCDFTNADLQRATAGEAMFKDCVWKACRFGGTTRHFDPMRAGGGSAC